MFAFFDENVVSEYPREQAIVDGVNVGEDILLIETDVTKNGARLMKQLIEYRDRLSRAKRWQQMDEDENVSYWLDDKEVEEWNFEEIPEDVSFYVNENNELVICFNEGDVAPMYMGTVEFVISNEVLGEIRK